MSPFSRTNNLALVTATVLASFLSLPIAQAEAIRTPSCPSILEGTSADSFDAKINKIVDSSNSGQAGLFSNPQSELDHQTMGPVAQDVFNNMDKYMVGHADVKRALALAVQRAALGTKDPNRPAGVFLLAGITGTGKTLASAALAQSVGLPAGAVTKIKGQEMNDEGDTSKLTGAPPRYVGYGDTPLVTQELLAKRTSEKFKVNVLLVDELEKSHVEFRNLLLGIMEEAKLTTAKKNKVIDFSHTIIILTTNLGQADMQALLHHKSIGFLQTTSAQKTDAQLEAAVKSAIQKELTAEFRNRLDGIFVFMQPTSEEANGILNMALATAQRQSFFSNENSRILFGLTPGARAFMLKNYFRPEMGGRSLRKAVESVIVNPLSNLLGSDTIKTGDVIKVDISSDGQSLTFVRRAHGFSFQQQVQLYQDMYGDNVPVPVESATESTADESAETPKISTSKALVPVSQQDGRSKLTLKKFNDLQLAHDYSEVKNVEGFKVFLQNVDETQNTCIKLSKMSAYVMTGEYFNAYALLKLLDRLPTRVMSCGAINSAIVTQHMIDDGIGTNLHEPILSLEPYALQIVALGVRRLETLNPRLKCHVLPVASDAMENIKVWMHDQKYPPSYRTPGYVSNYLDYLLSYAEALPAAQAG